MKIPYEVADPHAETIGGERVENGIVNLSDAQAEHWLRVGAVACLSMSFRASTPAIDVSCDDEVEVNLATGEVKKVEPRRRGRPRKVAADASGVTGLSPTNFPAEDPLVPPKPYLPVEDDSWEG